MEERAESTWRLAGLGAGDTQKRKTREGSVRTQVRVH